MVLILGFLLSPAVQQFYPFITPEKPLNGYFEISKDTVLNSDTWFDRTYQEKKENYLNENFGFRPFLVRVNNHFNFVFFNELNVKNLMRGKNNYLYTTDFLDSYSGRTFNGKELHADSVFSDLQKLNDTLLRMNKKLLICIAPCKESYYPEFLPDSCREKLSKQTYYTYYRSKFLSSNIPFLDYNDYFLKLKPNAKHPIFTQGALHWTSYAAGLAMDTLFKRVRYEIRKNMNLVKIKSLELSREPRQDDDDECKSMNLLKPLNTEELAYPSFEYLYNQDTCYRPKIFVLGDSFYYQINNTWVPVKIFSEESYFMYYFRTAISYGGKPDQDVSSVDIKKELKNTDLVILLYSVGNLTGFPYNATKLIQ